VFDSLLRLHTLDSRSCDLGSFACPIAGLTCRTTQSAQHCQPQPRPHASRASRSASSPSRPARNIGRAASRTGSVGPPLVGQRADGRAAPVGYDRPGGQVPLPGLGYFCAGPGRVGPGSAAFPWITPAAIPPPEVVIVMSRPAANE